VSIAALSGVTNREAGLASGLITTSQRIGGGIGLAILTSVATTRTNDLLSSGVAAPTALTEGFQAGLLGRRRPRRARRRRHSGPAQARQGSRLGGTSRVAASGQQVAA
jgi:hypothetical protein